MASVIAVAGVITSATVSPDGVGGGVGVALARKGGAEARGTSTSGAYATALV